MPPNNINVQAVHDVLLFYLQNRNNKSLWSFLLRYRELIVSSLTTNMNWRDLNNGWISFFLDEAKMIDPDNFDDLSKKPGNHSRSSISGVLSLLECLRCDQDLKNYWSDVKQEYEIRQDISNYQTEKESLLQAILEIDNQILAKDNDLMKFSTKWSVMKNFSYAHSEPPKEDNSNFDDERFDGGYNSNITIPKPRKRTVARLNNEHTIANRKRRTVALDNEQDVPEPSPARPDNEQDFN
ncbi:6268_t:CDS:2, partial [Funneliformis geosporum]